MVLFASRHVSPQYALIPSMPWISIFVWFKAETSLRFACAQLHRQGFCVLQSQSGFARAMANLREIAGF
jgi:hypothetical protein